MAVFAIDVGGTAIKLGIVQHTGTFFAASSIPFEKQESFDELCTRLGQALSALPAPPDDLATKIAISVPGFPKPQTGIMVDGCDNVPALKGNSLQQALADQLRMPAIIINDGVAAALGEANYGAGRHVPRFVLLTLGTGVGGAIIIDGKPLQFADGCPAEMGAIPVGHPLNGGREYALEYQACAGAFLRAAKGCTNSVEELFSMAERGNDTARQAISEVSRCIAQALAGLVNAAAIDTCIIGGGISAAGLALTTQIHEHMQDFVWPYLYPRVKVRTAQLGNNAGMLGAASRFWV